MSENPITFPQPSAGPAKESKQSETPRVLDQEFEQLAELLDKHCRRGSLADEFRDVVGGLMSIAFLIEDRTDCGNDNLDAVLANGLVQPLRGYAKRAGQLYYRSLLELKGVTREQLDEKH